MSRTDGSLTRRISSKWLGYGTIDMGFFLTIALVILSSRFSLLLLSFLSRSLLLSVKVEVFFFPVDGCLVLVLLFSSLFISFRNLPHSSHIDL